jgi:beta-lactamase superfamily II metal-dependent hydrolase
LSVTEDGELADTALVVEVLPASYGDCIFVTAPVDGGEYRILVDTGPDDATWHRLAARIGEIEPDSSGRRRIDLVIVSHIDHDHIGNSVRLLEDESLALDVGDVWFNGQRHLGVRGVEEAEALTDVLGDRWDRLPWNAAFAGDAVKVPDQAEDASGSYATIATTPGHPTITVLSPSQRELDALAATWDSEIARLTARESNTTVERRADLSASLQDLERVAGTPFREDRSRTNRSSIAVLIEHHGAGVLLGADAVPKLLGRNLVRLINDRIDDPPVIDAFKVCHHGSRGNTMDELIRLLVQVGTRHYLISTDGTRFGHPDDEALARVVCHGGSGTQLWFNSPAAGTQRWIDRAAQPDAKFLAHAPTDTTSGTRLVLPARDGPLDGRGRRTSA